MNSKTLVIDDAVPYAEAFFARFGKLVRLPGKAIQPQHLENADALIVRSRTQVNQALLENSPVRFVGSTVVGLDHIDQTYLRSNGIHFYSAQGCNANSVSEYIIANLLQLADQHQLDLTQTSLGILGVGHVGSLVAAKAQALGMQTLLNDPPRAEVEGEQGFVHLDTALEADIITVHTPLNKTGKHPTYHLIDPAKLQRIRPNQILINAARGGIIDEQAWVQTPTRANIIDCWENEPDINAELYQVADIATPHIAGHALDAKIAGSRMVYEALCRFWETPLETDWQSALPSAPAPISVTSSGHWQHDLLQVIQQCYDPRADDLAIRSKNILETHKKYEYYRRHYPIHREWPQHRLIPSGDALLDKTLYSLGFHPNP